MAMRNLLLLLLSSVVGDAFLDMKDNVAVVTAAKSVVNSLDFPSGCCVTSVYNIPSQMDGSCIKITIDDLDLPPQVLFQIIDVGSDEVKTLVHIQNRNASVSNVVCLSDLISSPNGSIKIVLDSTGVSYSRYYAGFRLHFTSDLGNCGHVRSNASKSSIRHHEPCRVISSVASGRQVSIDSAPVSQGVDVEFIWTIKLPDNIPPHDSDTSVFLRLNNSTLDGEVEIRRGGNSGSELILLWTSLDDPNMLPRAPFVSSHGIYVRVLVRKYRAGSSRFEFITGLYRRRVQSTAGWFQCFNSSWYIPQQYTCDALPHCPANEDENPTVCKARLKGAPPDEEDYLFLRWLIPVLGVFFVVGVVICSVKLVARNRKLQHETERNDECNNNCHESIEEATVSQSLLYPVSRSEAIGVPLPAARVPPAAVHIPVTGSVANLAPGSLSARRESIIAGGFYSRRNSVMGSLLGASPMGSNSSVPWQGRSAPIAIPGRSVANRTSFSTSTDANDGPIVVHPVIHRDAAVIPPSYDEVTAEHSCGDSIESLNEAPEAVLEYHPPSYEDASGGKTELVSSWVSSTRPSSP